MADEETFILVSLEEQKSKELAQVISNDTSRKILDYLGKKEGTETDISKKLGMPLSTVHYNMQQLLKAGLIESKEFIYSDKGKPVNIYTVAKKIIVIAPNKQNNLSETLKRLLPITIISAIASILIQVLVSIKDTGLLTTPKAFSERAASAGTILGTNSSAPMLASNASNQINQLSTIPSYGLFFFLGSLFIVVCYFFYTLLKKQ